MSKAVIYNKSKTYLLPLLSEIIEFDPRFIDSLENTFMYVDTEQYKDHLLVLHDYVINDPEFIEYESKLVENELYVDSIDIGNKVLYIFKFPEEYLHEYRCLEEGRYSSFGVDAKELILSFWNEIFKKHAAAVSLILRIKHILFKDKKLKIQLERELDTVIDDDAELGSVISKEQETFELSKHLKK